MSTSMPSLLRSCSLIVVQGTWIVSSSACVGVNPTFIDCDLVSGASSSNTHEIGYPCIEAESTATTGLGSNTSSDPTSGLDTTTNLDSNTVTDTGHIEELLIDFDDKTPAPDYFNQSSGPVSDEYAAIGVLFSGRSVTDGAGVLSYETWEAEGGSKPNFLALNCERTYPGGGVPCGDIVITLDRPATKIEFLSATDYTNLRLTAIARDTNDIIVAQKDCPTEEVLQPCSVVGSEIVEITLIMVPQAWYGIDDLRVTF